MQMGADTREHGVLVGGSRWYRRIIVICTWSRSADTIAFVPLFNIIRNDGWKSGGERQNTSGRITYTSTSQMHVRSASVTLSVISIWVVGHGRFPCRFSLRSARHALRTRERSSTLLGHGLDRSHGHPRFLLPRGDSFATSNRVTHGARKYGGEECSLEKRDSGMANAKSPRRAILYLFYAIESRHVRVNRSFA